MNGKRRSRKRLLQMPGGGKSNEFIILQFFLELNYVSDVEETEGGTQSEMGGYWWGEYQKHFQSQGLTWLDRHCIQKRSPVRVQRQGLHQRKMYMPRVIMEYQKLSI